MHVDHTGIFKDFNFKLIVIDAMLEQQPSFKAELERLKEQHTSKYEWYTGAGPIEELLVFFASLPLKQRDLDTVTELSFDGGNEIYHIIQPDWDGEDDLFDVVSVDGFEHLTRLKSVFYASMCQPEVLEPMKSAGIEIE
ncbi:hypothetical protein EBB07_18945 [Paenibacillaceae bacterium]|nr:hypothetical protein EBB07_18945 [Paenibacillaceae bacterium]